MNKRTGLRAITPLNLRVRTRDLQQVYRVDRSRWSRAEDAFRKRVQNLWSEVQVGRLTIEDLTKAFSTELHDYQKKVYILGKRTAGDFSSTISSDDARVLHGQHSREMRYFHNMVRQIEARTTIMPLPHRLDLYALGGYSIYLRGALSALPDDIRWGWKVDPVKEHCDGCLWREQMSREHDGFSTHELLTVYGLPTEKTPCGHRCGCIVFPHGINLRLGRTRPTTFSHVSRLLGVE